MTSTDTPNEQPRIEPGSRAELANQVANLIVGLFDDPHTEDAEALTKVGELVGLSPMVRKGKVIGLEQLLPEDAPAPVDGEQAPEQVDVDGMVTVADILGAAPAGLLGEQPERVLDGWNRCGYWVGVHVEPSLADQQAAGLHITRARCMGPNSDCGCGHEIVTPWQPGRHHRP